MTVQDLAAFLEIPFEGDGALELRRVAPLDEAGPADLSFAQGRALKLIAESAAGCVIVPTNFANDSNRTILRAPDPRAAAARAIAKLHPHPQPEPGIHPTAVIAPGAEIASSASIGPLVTVAPGVRIGEHTSIGAGSTIAENVEIGARCTIHAHVTIYRDVTIGDECVLHSGCVIGADGFGFVMTGGAYEKFPQVGRVELGNRVEIGANSCIDRAALGVTTIG